jgi:F-type H+-transporting ATPase subunit delta
MTARDLGETERRALESQVGKLTGKKVRAQYARDASLLGGAVVRVGSTIYDGSVLGQLNRIKEAISS